MSDKLSSSNVARLLWSLIDFVAAPVGLDCYGAARTVADFLRLIPGDAWLNGATLVLLDSGHFQIEFARHAKLLELEFTKDGQVISRKVLRSKSVEEAAFPASDIDRALAQIDWLYSN